MSRNGAAGTKMDAKAIFTAKQSVGHLAVVRLPLRRLRPHGRTLAENSGHLRSGDVSDRARLGAAMRSGAEPAERASDWKPFSAGRGPEGTTWNYAQSVAANRDGAVAHLGGVKEMHGHAGL
ncbi:hypothetical protein [Aminobacter sp. BE322]|uniref:hypothetical protein n=1 Tax=unclassified Aminobacter TaxID=2644704 RepID=UPI003D2091EC